MDTAVYLRKSRAEEQTDTVEQTLARHKEILIDYAQKYQHSVLHIYEEVVSGESLYARPQMLRLLQDVEAGKYDAVLCMDIDRLGRGGMRDQGIILDAFKYSSTLIITPDKTYDLNNDTDEVLTEFKTFMSRQELKIIKKRLQRGKEQTIAKGGYTSNPPYGYRRVFVNKLPTLEIVEEEAKFVRMMFDMYIAGIGCETIAQKVNSMGAKPRRSNSFARTSIRKIISSPTYCGKIVWNQKRHIRKGEQGNDKHQVTYNPPEKWVITDGVHPSIISGEVFEKANEILRGRYIPSKKVAGVLINPLAGLLKCRSCGRSIQLQRFKGVEYLRCMSTGCTSSSQSEPIEEAILEQVQLKLQSLSLPKANEKQINTASLEQARKQCLKEIETAANQLDRLRDLLEQGIYDVDTYRERSEKLKQKISALTQQDEALKKEIDHLLCKDMELFKQKLQNVLDLYHDSDARGKNMLLKSVIRSISYDRPDRKSSASLAVSFRDF